MSFEQFLINSFNKTTLQSNTKTNYITNIFKIYQAVNLQSNNEEFFYYTDEITNYINSLNKANSTKRSYYTCILKLLSVCSVEPEIIEFYKNQCNSYVNLEKTDAQIKLDNMAVNSDKWCSLEELQTVPYLLIDDIVKIFNLTKAGEFFFSCIFISYDEYNSYDRHRKVRYMMLIQDFIIAYMHMIRVSLRLELFNTLIVTKIDDSLKDVNFILHSNGKMILYLNKFKNVNTFGKTTQTFNNEEYNLVKLWLQLHEYNTEYILNNQNQFVLTSRIPRTDLNTKLLYYNTYNAYGNRLISLTKKYLKKPLTCTIIRKIWETHFQTSESYKSLSNADKSTLHKKLLHNIDVASSSYNVYDPKNVIDEKDNKLLKYIKEEADITTDEASG